MWPWIQWELISTLLLAQPVVLSNEAVTIPLISREDTALGKRLSDIARDPTQNVVLVLKGVEADAPPEASWEICVGPADTKRCAQSPYFVGILSLYGQGIRSEGGKNYRPAEFVFPLDRAIAAAGAENLQATFVPTSGVVVEGRPLPAKVRSNVRIGEISLAIDSAQPQGQEQQPGQEE